MTEFEEWYLLERPVVLSACIALCGDLDGAREATDEAFTRAFERWERVGVMQAPGAWTQTVALNYLRRRQRRRFLFGRVGRQPEAACASPLPDWELWEAVRALPPRQQMAVVLRYVHDMSYEQIAEAMRISTGAVASTLTAARHKLAGLTSAVEQQEAVDG